MCRDAVVGQSSRTPQLVGTAECSTGLTAEPEGWRRSAVRGHFPMATASNRGATLARGLKKQAPDPRSRMPLES
eukprot:s2006_g1.t1